MMDPEEKTTDSIPTFNTDFKNFSNTSKRILNKYEEVNESASRKKGFSAQQIAEIICRENVELLQLKEVMELIRAWDSDRRELQVYRKIERRKNRKEV